jgi:hypothetical protein
MILRQPRERPHPWSSRGIRRRWAVPFFALEWMWEWAAFLLSNWTFLEVLEYLSSLSVLVAVILFFSEADSRLKQKHYQAWQVINTAQGKGGSGGRIEALQELNADHVDLVGVDVSGAFLRGIDLHNSRLVRANLSSIDARNGNFQSADLTDANLSSANFRKSNFHNAELQGSTLDDADLVGADLSHADLSGATLDNIDLRQTNLDGMNWKQIKSIKGANVYGVRNAPDGFTDWAVHGGAVQTPPDGKSGDGQPAR